MSAFIVTTPASSGRRVVPWDGNRYRVIAASSVPDRETTWTSLEFPLAVALGSGQRGVRQRSGSGTQGGLLDLHEELGVALGLAHLLHEQLERLLRLERVQHPAQLPDDLELVRREQDLFLTGARRVHVDRREEPLLRELAAQPQLHVAGALELLEDDLVHPGAGLDQGRGQDRQRAAVLDVAGRAEEPLGRVQRGGVHPTGQDAAAGRGRVVVGPAEAGDVVEQDDHVVAHLYQPLGPLDGQLGDRGVVVGRVVERGVDDLALHRALHVGDLFRPLVDEDDHEVALGVVLGDGVGDRLEDRGLARLGRRHDQAALALADGADEVDDPGEHVARVGLQAEPFLRVQRHQLGELRPGQRLLGVQPVDLVQADQRVELLPALALARLPDGALDDVALAQAMLAHLGERDVHVVRTGQVAGGADERVALRVEHVEDAGDRDEDVVLADHGLRVGLPVATAVAVPEPVPAAAAAVVVVVAAPGRHRLPVPAALVAAAVTATVIAPALLPAAAVPAVTAGLVAAALVPVALIAAAAVTGVAAVATGLVTAGPVALVPAARGLVLAPPVPAPPVTALDVARRGVVARTRLAVLAGARRRAGRLLSSGGLSLPLGACLRRRRLLGRSLLSGGLPGVSLLSGCRLSCRS